MDASSQVTAIRPTKIRPRDPTQVEGDLCLRNASHANAMARRLADAIAGVPGVRVMRPVQANAVFAILPPAVTKRLQEQFRFYVWDEATGEVRWMTTFDTTVADIDLFAASITREMASLHPR